MNHHGELAKQLFFDGYNCAQSVFCAFCDVHGMSLADAQRFSASFGGGMGRLREVCGAMSGVFMVIGALYGDYEVTDRDAKTAHYTMIQELAAKFQERYPLICRDILGLPEGPSHPQPEPHTPEYLAIRPCPGCVQYASELLDEFLTARSVTTIQ